MSWSRLKSARESASFADSGLSVDTAASTSVRSNRVTCNAGLLTGNAARPMSQRLSATIDSISSRLPRSSRMMVRGDNWRSRATDRSRMSECSSGCVATILKRLAWKWTMASTTSDRFSSVLSADSDLLEEQLAFAGEHDAPAAFAIEQAKADGILELRDLPADGGLGLAQVFGRVRDAARLAHGEKGAQLADLDVVDHVELDLFPRMDVTR